MEELTFEESGHIYRWNGQIVPSTTLICSILAPRWPVEEYSKIKGKIIHTITNFEDHNELLEESVDPLLAGYLAGYRRMKLETGFKVHKTELQFYNRKYGYAGRVDKYGELFNYMGVLDVKSGAPHEADTYQAPAYLFGLKDNKIPCWRAWDLYLKANGCYKLEEVKNPTEKFLKFLGGIQKWREENNGNMYRI